MTRNIAIVGGTGPQGRGLAYRLARAGHTVTVGSRDPHRAAAVAAELSVLPGAREPVMGRTNVEAAGAAEVVVLAVPYAGHAALVAAVKSCLAGKVVVSCVNPLGFDKGGPYGLTVPDGSAAEETARLVPEAQVVASFHHLAAPLLTDPDTDLSNEDVLVCGDDQTAKDVAAGLAVDVTGGRAVDVGGLRLARQLESFTAVLISVNKRYRTHSGVSLTGITPRTNGVQV